MIYEYNFFHGAAINDLIHKKIINSVVIYPSESNASYVVDDKIGIYIKYSTKRLSPWRFTFKRIHQNEILEMKERLGQIFLLLVCNDDGIVCISFQELKLILDSEHGEAEWISISRTKRKQYTVKGSDGKLRFKMGVNDYEILSKVLKDEEDF